MWKRRKRLDAETEGTSGKSGSVEEIGFGFVQKDKGNKGKEAVGGSQGGRWRGETELGCEWEEGIKLLNGSVGREG